ncbi:AbrB/MazE/SpoVT family DNA-binding domain-containing protein [Pseudomonas sp. DP16D-R1]|uniref:AbrB/MazE/SpoVT family DNA-binding domain-containing protein n=1 Tax=Pseudomonas sp. DP16D-R1 TaxID=2075551 RepID=UPI000CD1312D|nr:AbrB/MazE/SpoVT family DNA-binding domain-containing protein [Pseudomonas sp. DP16D-R1]POA70792.1 AbrB family transcriptional regulator [Pseudomonas sp. DP16D-R1]
MKQIESWTVECQDPGDNSGDVIVDLPDEVLRVMGVGIGDQLSVELVDGAIVLKPVREANEKTHTE